MSKPVLSVIMAAKDREKFIGESIESYLKQNFKQFELIIINDHSSDKTLNVAKSYQDHNSNIKILSLPKNITGISAARDYGIKKAESDIMVIGDSDDIAERSRLKTINNIFKENKKCQCFYSNCQLLYESNNKLVVRPFQPHNKKLLKSINYIPNSSTAFRKRAYQKIGGYDKNLLMGEDYDLWLTFLDNNLSFSYSNKHLIIIRIHNNSIRSKKREQAKYYVDKIRRKHNITTPTIDEIKLMCDKKYWKYIATPYGLNLWF